MKRTLNSEGSKEEQKQDEPFLSRFHRKKTEARQLDKSDVNEQQALADETEAAYLTDEDMPPIESLTPDSDYTGFMSPRVSEELRNLALRKLFHSAEFNVISELDEYAEDFTTFAPMGDLVTADMRHQLEVEAKRKLEALKEAVLDDEESEKTEQQEPEENVQLEHTDDNQTITNDRQS